MAARGEILWPPVGRSDVRAWGDPMAAVMPGAPPSVLCSSGPLVVRSSPTHILTVHVATILTHVSATIRLALRSLR